jgi:hypothetical protein
VDHAIAEQVDLVLASGDLVDEANRFLEAIGPLERGLQRLREVGIETVAVSGNHDHEVLPAIADQIGEGGLRLLGRRGRWERYTFENRSGERVHLDGWSFPRGRVEESPLASYAPLFPDNAPVLALLHADVDSPGSSFAPVASVEMRRFPGVLFLLGHIHRTRGINEPGGARFLYAGSPQAMDPGETGAHGAWILEFGAAGNSVRHLPLSTVRYETIEVDIGGVSRPEDAQGRLHGALREHLEEIAGQSGPLELVRYRPRITGATRFPRLIEEKLAGSDETLEVPSGRLTGTVEVLHFAMKPERDLEALAAGVGAPAVLARLLLSPDNLPPALRDELRRKVNEIHSSTVFVEVSGVEVSGGEAKGGEADEADPAGSDDSASRTTAMDAELMRAAAVLLEELLGQKVA